MIQIKRTRLLPSILIASMLALLMTLVAAPQQAEACGSYGPPTQEDLVRSAIVSHLLAVRDGNRKQVNAAWSQTAGHSKTLVTKGGVEKVRSEAIGTASRRWAKNKDSKMTWTIKQMDVDQKAAFAKLAIDWNGEKRVEYLTLLKVNGAWTLVGKVHVSAEPPASKAKKVSLY